MIGRIFMGLEQRRAALGKVMCCRVTSKIIER